MRLTTQHAANLAELLIFAIDQYRRAGSRKYPLDTRLAEQIARDLRNGSTLVVESPEMSAAGHSASPPAPRMVTISEVVRVRGGSEGSPGGGVSAQRLERKLRRWAEGGKITARRVGNTWEIDEDEALRKLTERATA